MKNSIHILQFEYYNLVNDNRGISILCFVKMNEPLEINHQSKRHGRRHNNRQHSIVEVTDEVQPQHVNTRHDNTHNTQPVSTHTTHTTQHVPTPNTTHTTHTTHNNRNRRTPDGQKSACDEHPVSTVPLQNIPSFLHLMEYCWSGFTPGTTNTPGREWLIGAKTIDSQPNNFTKMWRVPSAAKFVEYIAEIQQPPEEVSHVSSGIRPKYLYCWLTTFSSREINLSDVIKKLQTDITDNIDSSERDLVKLKKQRDLITLSCEATTDTYEKNKRVSNQQRDLAPMDCDDYNIMIPGYPPDTTYLLR